MLQLFQIMLIQITFLHVCSLNLNFTLSRSCAHQKVVSDGKIFRGFESYLKIGMSCCLSQFLCLKLKSTESKRLWVKFQIIALSIKDKHSLHRLKSHNILDFRDLKQQEGRECVFVPSSVLSSACLHVLSCFNH